MNLDLKNYLGGETLTIEYKDDQKEHFSDELIIKACVSLANASGGVVLIGVTDNGTVVGSKRAKQGDERALEGMIRERTTPCVNVSVFFLNYEDNIVVLIKVEKSIDVVSTTKGLYLKRRLNSQGKPENSPMSLDEILRGTTRFGMNDLSAATLSGVSINDLDLDLVQETAKEILQNKPSDAEQEIFNNDPVKILKSLGLIDKNNIPNIASLLLFGTEDVIKERIPNHFVQYQVFGNSGEILRNDKFYSPIVKLFPLLIDAPEISMNSNEIIVNGRSIIIPEYSKLAIREAFANAFVHRDYTMHSGIQIQVFPSELKITSAGGFLEGITIDNLLSVAPTPRNRRLAEAMMRMKFVETSGRGIDIIYYSQAKFGRPAPDYSATTTSNVIVRLVGGNANIDFCRFVMSLGEPSLKEMLILNALFYQRSMSLAEISKLIQSSDLTTKQILNELIKKGWIEILDEKNPLYLLKGTLDENNKRMNKKTQKDFKENILNLLKQHPNLNRTKIAMALNLTSPQTYRLLTSLQSENKVILDGKTWKLKN